MGLPSAISARTAERQPERAGTGSRALGPGGWLPRLLPIAVYLGFAFSLSFVMGSKDSDLDVFFWPSAELAAHGHPLLIYSIHAGPYPNANGPLSLLPLTFVALIANSVGWASNPPLRDGLVLVVFSIFTLLAAHEAVHLLECSGITGRRMATYAGICLSIPLWLALGSFGHVEIPLEIWLTLVALRFALGQRVLATGLILGLVLLTRSSAVVLAIALALFFAAEPRRWPPLLRCLRSLSVLAIAVATMLVGLAPFLLANSRAAISSLVSFRGSLPISGGSAWVVVARGLPWGGFVQHFDVLLMVMAAVLLVGLALVTAPETPLDVRRAASLLTVAACCVPLLAKTTWAYYLAEPYTFAAVVVVARRGSMTARGWGIPILLALTSLTLAAVGLSAPPSALEKAIGVAAGIVVAGAVYAAMREAARLRLGSVPPALLAGGSADSGRAGSHP
jgi:hypothetical protein